MADPAQHRVVGPHGQVVLAALGQPARVVLQVALGVLGVQPAAAATSGIHPPPALGRVLRGDQRHRLGPVALGVDQPGRVEDLHRVVGVQAGHDLRDRARGCGTRTRTGAGCRPPRPVPERRPRTARSPGCRTCSARPPAAGPRGGRRPRRRPARAARPVLGLARPVLVGHPPHLAHAARGRSGRGAAARPWRSGYVVAMDPTTVAAAEAFSGHDFEAAFDLLADDVRGTTSVFGQRPARTRVVEACPRRTPQYFVQA